MVWRKASPQETRRNSPHQSWWSSFGIDCAVRIGSTMRPKCHAIGSQGVKDRAANTHSLASTARHNVQRTSYTIFCHASARDGMSYHELSIVIMQTQQHARASWNWVARLCSQCHCFKDVATTTHTAIDEHGKGLLVQAVVAKYREIPNRKRVSIVSQSKIWKIATFSLNNLSAPWWHQPPSRLPWLQATPRAAKLDWTLSTPIQICKGPPYPKPSIYFIKSHPFPTSMPGRQVSNCRPPWLDRTQPARPACAQSDAPTQRKGWWKPFNGSPWRPSRHPQRTAHPSTRPGRCGK